MGPVPGAPRVSVCATHLNDWPAVRDWAQSLLAQAPRDVEVVVVDAGSRGPSWEYLQDLARKDARVRLVREPGASRGRGRDLAWRSARAPIVLHTDTDRTWKPGAWKKLEALLPRLREGPVKLLSPLGLIRLGGFLLTRRQLEAIDGYDPTLQYFEDTDLERRLRSRFSMQEAEFDVYAHDDKRKMRSIRTNFRYHRQMFFDGARIGNSLSYMLRPSRARPWRWPFLLAGWLAYRRGLRAPPARSRRDSS